jgi:hypothetical protein
MTTAGTPTTESRCPSERPFCFNKERGKKNMEKTCNKNEEYDPIENLKHISTQPTNPDIIDCTEQTNCYCVQFDIAWLTNVSEMQSRLTDMITIITDTDSVKKKDVVNQAQAALSSGEDPIQKIIEYFGAVIEVAKERWKQQPSEIAKDFIDKMTQLQTILKNNLSELSTQVKETAPNITENQLNPTPDVKKAINIVSNIINCALYVMNEPDKLDKGSLTHLDEIIQTFAPPTKTGGRKTKRKKNKKRSRKHKRANKKTKIRRQQGGEIVLITIIVIVGIIFVWGLKGSKERERAKRRS